VNPYQNRGPIFQPDGFVGRERELAQIRDSIEQGGCVSLIGERRVGKSSILNMIKLDHEVRRFEWQMGPAEQQREYVCLFVDCQYLVGATESEAIQFLLERFEDSFGTPRVEPTLEALRVVTRQSVGVSGTRLVLLLDEIDVLAANANLRPSFFSFLRGWSQDFRIVFLSASKENNVERLTWNDNAGSPFWNIFRTLYIGPFTQEDAEWLVREPSALQGCEFSPDDERLIFDLGGRQPLFLQIACDHTFQARAADLPPPGLTREVKSRFRVEAVPHLDYLWKSLPKREREALTQFILQKRSPSDRDASELLRKGVLVEEPTGMRVFSSVFAERIEDLSEAAPQPAGILSRAWNKYLE